MCQERTETTKDYGGPPPRKTAANRKAINVTSLANSSAPVNTAGERELLIHSLRLAVARARLVVNELETIGVSLRHRAVDTDSAMKWLAEEGLLNWIELGPSGAKS